MYCKALGIKDQLFFLLGANFESKVYFYFIFLQIWILMEALGAIWLEVT